MKKAILLVLACTLVCALCACSPEDVIPVNEQDVESAFEEIFSNAEEGTEPAEIVQSEEDSEEIVGTATGSNLEIITEDLQDDYIQEFAPEQDAAEDAE